MAAIIIKRRSEFINRARVYQLFLDGVKIGTIANGQTQELETTAGQHTILAKIDWCSSPEVSFTLSETDEKTLTLGGFKNSNWIMPVGMALIAVHFILNFTFDFPYLILLPLPLFILLLYYITAGRKKYLTLSE